MNWQQQYYGGGDNMPHYVHAYAFSIMYNE